MGLIIGNGAIYENGVIKRVSTPKVEKKVEKTVEKATQKAEPKEQPKPETKAEAPKETPKAGVEVKEPQKKPIESKSIIDGSQIKRTPRKKTTKKK